MKRFHRLQILAAAFLFAQLAIGYAGWFTPKHEVFPFASWFLFLLVPDRITDYDIVLHGTPEHPQEPPRPFNQSAVLVRTPHSVASYQLIQQLGEAVQQHNPAQADIARRQIEEQFNFRNIRYDLLQVTFRPVDRLKSNRVLSSRTICSFVADQMQTPPAAALPAARL